MRAIAPASHNGVVLYVEDDALMRASVAQLLLRRGYQVLQAASGEEALDLIKRGPVPTAMLLDLELPGMDGIETYRRLLRVQPALAAVVCSAQLTAAMRRDLSELGVADECLLSKPCEFDDVLRALRRASRAASGE